MKKSYSVIVIGAGPAGLCAATLAAEQGLDVALFDSQAAPGGQIFRSIETVPLSRATVLGTEYQRGHELVENFHASGVEYFPGTQVWSVSANGQVGIVRHGSARMVHANQVLLAQGAMERPVPFPGWTLPGVMNAGAGQILYKAHGIVPDGEVVLAGSGPLLVLLAWQYLRAGVPIQEILDVTPAGNHLRALPRFPRALLARHYLSKGLLYQGDIKRAGVKTRYGITDLAAHGEEKLSGISFTHKGAAHNISAGLMLLHFGVIPAISLAQSAGCELYWDRHQLCWRASLDKWGNSSIHGLLIAGDGAGIGGARTAEHAGRIAGFQMLYALGKITRKDRDSLSKKDRQWMREEQHIRPFLEAYFRIPDRLLNHPDDDTVICRCEEVTAGQIRSAVEDGLEDTNQVKFLTRCGMGPCQGRQCSNNVAHIVSSMTGKAVSACGAYRGRPPVAPLSLGQLAGLYGDADTAGAATDLDTGVSGEVSP